MKRYLLTLPASQDIDEILDYISTQSVQTAITVAQRLENTFQRIAEMPGIGHERPELKDPHVRVLAESGYLLIYDPSLCPVHILRVVRGSRNLKSIQPRQ